MVAVSWIGSGTRISAGPSPVPRATVVSGPGEPPSGGLVLGMAQSPPAMPVPGDAPRAPAGTPSGPGRREASSHAARLAAKSRSGSLRSGIGGCRRSIAYARDAVDVDGEASRTRPILDAGDEGSSTGSARIVWAARPGARGQPGTTGVLCVGIFGSRNETGTQLVVRCDQRPVSRLSRRKVHPEVYARFRHIVGGKAPAR
jgi:hypothetical protein